MNEVISTGFFHSSDPYRAPSRPTASVREIPYDGQTQMRLTIVSGLSRARVRIDPNAEALVSLDHGAAPPPELRSAGSEVRVAWPAWSIHEWLRAVFAGHPAEIEIALHPAVAWEISVRGGISSLDSDLSAGMVTRIEVAGGCSNVAIQLPRPAQTVPIKISGGASHVSLRRPADVAVSVAVSGGIASLRLDDRTFDALGGSARLETPRAVAGSAGYDVVVSGGASNVEIEGA
jgi:hypothetical protein